MGIKFKCERGIQKEEGRTIKIISPVPFVMLLLSSVRLAGASVTLKYAALGIPNFTVHTTHTSEEKNDANGGVDVTASLDEA